MASPGNWHCANCIVRSLLNPDLSLPFGEPSRLQMADERRMKESIGRVVDTVNLQTELSTSVGGGDVVIVHEQCDIGDVNVARVSVTTVWIAAQRTH